MTTDLHLVVDNDCAPVHLKEAVALLVMRQVMAQLEQRVEPAIFEKVSKELSDGLLKHAMAMQDSINKGLESNAKEIAALKSEVNELRLLVSAIALGRPLVIGKGETYTIRTHLIEEGDNDGGDAA